MGMPEKHSAADCTRRCQLPVLENQLLASVFMSEAGGMLLARPLHLSRLDISIPVHIF